MTVALSPGRGLCPGPAPSSWLVLCPAGWPRAARTEAPFLPGELPEGERHRHRHLWGARKRAPQVRGCGSCARCPAPSVAQSLWVVDPVHSSPAALPGVVGALLLWGGAALEKVPVQPLGVEAGGAGVQALSPTLQCLGAAECLFLSQAGRPPPPGRFPSSMFSKVPHPVSSEEGCWTGTQSPLGTWPDFTLARATPHGPWGAAPPPPLSLSRTLAGGRASTSVCKGASPTLQRPILRTEGPRDPLWVRNGVGMSLCSGPCTRNANGRGGLGRVRPSVSQLTQVQGSTTRAQGGGPSEVGHPTSKLQDRSGFRLVQGRPVDRRWESRGS